VIAGLSTADALVHRADGSWWLQQGAHEAPARWHARLEFPGTGWWLALRAAGQVHWLWIARRRLPRDVAAALGVSLRADRARPA
jgi:hypothetical protein